jgi:hypothetical protein
VATTTVTGTWLTPSSDPAQGRVVFKLVAATFHGTWEAIVPQVLEVAVLDASGSISLELEPTSGVDAAYAATDMTYEVRELIHGAERDPYWVDIPTAPAVDLGTLATYETAPNFVRTIVTPDLSTLGFATLADVRLYGISPADYGAVGDGVADDTAAIQSAIDSLGADGATIYLQPGTYKVTSTLIADGIRGFTLIGAGRDATFLDATAAVAGTPVIKLIDYYTNTIADLTIRGTVGDEPSAGIHSRRDQAPTSPTVGYTNQNLTVRDVRMEKVERGIHWTADTLAQDGNNDMADIIDCGVYQATVAAYDIGHSNALGHRFIGGLIHTSPIAWRFAGGSAVVIGTAVIEIDDVEVDVTAGTYYHPIEFNGVMSEHTADVIRTAAVAGLNVAYVNYSKKGATASSDVIDWNATGNNLFTMTDSRLNLGQTGTKAIFSHATSRARFTNCFLGLAEYEFEGTLVMLGNKHEPGSVTITDGAAAVFSQWGDEGGGFEPTYLTSRDSGLERLTVPGDVVTESVYAVGATPVMGLGDVTAASNPTFTFNAAGALQTGIKFQSSGTDKWYVYKQVGDEQFYIRDQVNSKAHIALLAGAGAGGGLTTLSSGLKVNGSLGFYGTTPIAQQTGVAVSAAGIHAALVALGLITA